MSKTMSEIEKEARPAAHGFVMKVMTKSDGIMGVQVWVPWIGVGDVEVVEAQPRLKGILLDVVELHEKVKSSLRIRVDDCSMTIVSDQFDEVIVAAAFPYKHDISKSIHRMMQRAAKKLVELTTREPRELPKPVEQPQPEGE